MREILLDQAQPYGVVHEVHTFAGSPCDYGFMSKPLGPESVRLNHGADHAPSFKDKAPNAHAYACRNSDQPFAPVGLDFNRRY